MRLNRGTIALIVISLVIIVGVLLINNNPAAAPGTPTSTPGTAAGPLWQGVDQNTVTRLEVRDNHSGEAIVLSKAQNGGWDIADSAAGEQALTGAASSVTYVKPQALPIDTAKVSSTVGAFAGLQSSDRFETDTPADFGLDKPQYTIYAATSSGTIYAIHVGNKNPNSTRYYAAIEQIAGASATAEATSASSATEQAGATAEATAAPSATQQVAATAEATAAPSATEQVGATAEATAASTEATAEATPQQLAEPLVALTGKQTVYLLPQDVVTGMIGFLTSAPYIYPTATPSPFPTANPYSEVQQTATAAMEQTAMQSTMQAIIATATAQAAKTAEATAAATAEATP